MRERLEENELQCAACGFIGDEKKFLQFISLQ